MTTLVIGQCQMQARNRLRDVGTGLDTKRRYVDGAKHCQLFKVKDLNTKTIIPDAIMPSRQ